MTKAKIIVTIDIEALTTIGTFASYRVPIISTKVPVITTILIIAILKVVTRVKLSLQMPVIPIRAKAMAKMPANTARTK